MADNFLITGYWGEPHVTAENDRGLNAATFGKGRFVLPIGEQFRAEYIGNNTIRLYDGKLIDNGAAAGIPAGEYVDLLIANAGQGMKRNDLIVFQYEKDGSTLIESGKFVVIKGTETSGTASDPELTQQDLLSNEATFDQFALWRVPVSGTAISAPKKVFSVSRGLDNTAPSGYGLGENTTGHFPTSEKDLENILDNILKTMPDGATGFYRILDNGAALWGGGTCIATVFKTDNNHATVDFHGYHIYSSRIKKSKYNGNWEQLEWENPPMQENKEYKTTEQWKGNSVYKRLIDFGTLPTAGTDDTVNVNIGSDFSIIDYRGIITKSHGNTFVSMSATNFIKATWISKNNTIATFGVGTTDDATDVTEYSLLIELKYIKL